MWEWIAGFLQTLPTWWGVALWCFGGLLFPLLFSAAASSDGEISDAAPTLLVLTIGFYTLALVSEGWRSIVFGVAVFLLLSGVINLSELIARGLRRLWQWCAASYRSYQERREQDPQRILARCREYIVGAKLARKKYMESSKDTEEVILFDQECDNLLRFLGDILAMIGDGEALLSRSEKRKHSRVNQKELARRLKIARAIRSDLIGYLEDLPELVTAHNFDRHAAGIEGFFRNNVAVVMPGGESSSVTLADLESGQKRRRYVDQLAGAANPQRPDPVRGG